MVSDRMLSDYFLQLFELKCILSQENKEKGKNMKRVGLLLPAGALTALLLSSCTPDLAETSYGEKENDWQNYLQKSYPAWRAPKTLPPIKKEKITGPFDEFSEKENAASAEESVSVTEPVVENGPVKESITTVISGKGGHELIVSDDITIEGVGIPATPATVEAAAKPVPPAAPKTYKVQKNDTLSGIAKKVYGDGRKYGIILKANKDVLPNPNKLKTGMELRIPQLP